MAQFAVSTSNEQSIHAALELSKNSWLLAIQVIGPPNTGDRCVTYRLVREAETLAHRARLGIRPPSAMSESGHKQTSAVSEATTALPPKADIENRAANVR